jgi:hypothetical protein
MLSQWRTVRANLPSLLVMYAYKTVRRSVASFVWCVNPVGVCP